MRISDWSSDVGSSDLGHSSRSWARLRFRRFNYALKRGASSLHGKLVGGGRVRIARIEKIKPLFDRLRPGVWVNPQARGYTIEEGLAEPWPVAALQRRLRRVFPALWRGEGRLTRDARIKNGEIGRAHV